MPNVRGLVLASGSRARRAMLEAAGLTFSVALPPVDERAMRDSLLERGTVAAREIALALARAKAEAVSVTSPGSLVIGADQVLALGDRLFEKAATEEEARAILRALRGRTHDLHSAVALAEDGRVSWDHAETARMTMRPFSGAFLDHYVAHAGPGLLRSVGAYEFEGMGTQLFEKIDGDYFTILGLPLMALLGELRRRELIPG